MSNSNYVIYIPPETHCSVVIHCRTRTSIALVFSYQHVIVFSERAKKKVPAWLPLQKLCKQILTKMLNFKLVERVNPMDPNANNKLYPVKQAQETLTLRDFANRISRESTVSHMDAMAVLEGLLQILPKEVAAGKIIKLGDFGTFRTTISASGADTVEDFSIANIRKLNVRFRPTLVFNNILGNVQYKKIS